MNRILALLAVPLLTLGLAACGDDDSTVADDATATTTTTEAVTTTGPEETTTTEAPPAGEIVLEVADTSLGEVLVDSQGYTLYFFEPDTEEASACTEGCAEAWPPQPYFNDGTVGDGADATLLGTAPREDGSQQATYNGHRLYTYSGDKAAGDTTGDGVGDVWHAVTPEGEAA